MKLLLIAYYVFQFLNKEMAETAVKIVKELTETLVK